MGTTLATSAGMFRQGLQRIPWDGTIRELGTLWTITGPRGDTVRCYLTTHPHGWDLRLERDGELIRTQTFSDPTALVECATEWRAQTGG